MEFILGMVVGAIVILVIACVIKIDLPGDKGINTQPEFAPIATQEELDDAHETLGSSIRINLRLYKELDYWKREAIKNAAKLGEQKIRLEELKEKYKHVKN